MRTAVEDGVPKYYDGLYDGEHSATFDPRTNALRRLHITLQAIVRSVLIGFSYDLKGF